MDLFNEIQISRLILAPQICEIYMFNQRFFYFTFEAIEF